MNIENYNSYLLQVLKSKNITSAANELGISQPALSMGLSQLEKKLGFRILNRKAVPIELTATGELYVDYLKQISIAKKDFDIRLEELNSSIEKHITIGSPNAYISSIIAPSIKAIINIDPKIKLKIECASVPELTDMCSDSKIDFFISTKDFSDSFFSCIPIKKENTFLCVPKLFEIPNDISNKDTKIKILKTIPLIYLQKNQPMQVALDSIIKQYNISTNPIITVDQITSAISFALEGIGACLVTSESIKPYINTYELNFIPFSEFIPSRVIYAVFPKKRHISPICLDIINILKEKY